MEITKAEGDRQARSGYKEADSVRSEGPWPHRGLVVAPEVPRLGQVSSLEAQAECVLTGHDRSGEGEASPEGHQTSVGDRAQDPNHQRHQTDHAAGLTSEGSRVAYVGTAWAALRGSERRQWHLTAIDANGTVLDPA
jgi:hypothetical protein